MALAQPQAMMSDIWTVGEFSKDVGALLPFTPPSRTGSVTDKVATVAKHIFEDKLLSSGVSVLAKSVGMRTVQFDQAVRDLSALVLVLNRCAWSSLATKILDWIDRGMLSGLCMATSVQYDETPTKMSLPDHAGHPQRRIRGKKAEKNCKQLAKVVQIELQLCLLVSGPLTGDKPMAFHGELLCSLKVVDSLSADCLVAILKEVYTSILALEALRAHVYNIDISCCDRASANLKCERSWRTLHMPRPTVIEL